jgi:single-strand DNA-binding protein
MVGRREERAMASFSQVNLLGNLGRDPETRYTPNGTMNVSFSLATNRRWTDSNGQQQERTTWFNITAWGNLADTVNKLAQDGYLAKGRQVFVSGRLDSREYADRNGVNRTSLDVYALDIKLVGGPRDDGDGTFGAESRAPAGRSQESEGDIGDDIEDVPF